VLLNVEVMLLGVGLYFVSSSCVLQDPRGFVFAVCLLVIAAAESCVGLAILVAVFRTRRHVALPELTYLD
jgi:NADH-quinone oxidoreductase subunit K